MGFGSGRPAPPLERLWRHISVEDRGYTTPCWVWTGAAQQYAHGAYGNFNMGGGRYLRAYKASYELHVGPVPAGLVLDHLCRVTLCVNPAHLEPVTNRENLMRGTAPMITLHHAGRCMRGHPAADAYRYPPGNPRAGRVAFCKTCLREGLR